MRFFASNDKCQYLSENVPIVFILTKNASNLPFPQI